MRAILAFGAAWAFSVAAFAQDTVPIMFDPGANTTWRVEEVRTRTNSAQADRNVSGTTRATLRIGAASGQGYAASWTTDEIEVGGQVERGQNFSQFVGTPFQMQLDVAGAPISLDDWPATLARIMSAVEEINGGGDPEAHAAVERMMAAWSPAQAAQVLMQTVSVISVCQHTNLTIGETIEAETLVANPFGGEAILATERLELVSVDRAGNSARLRYSRSLDPASATRAIVAGLRNLVRDAGQASEEALAQFEGATLTHDTVADCDVDLRTGMVRSVLYDARVQMAGAVQTDRREIRVTRVE